MNQSINQSSINYYTSNQSNHQSSKRSSKQLINQLITYWKLIDYTYFVYCTSIYDDFPFFFTGRVRDDNNRQRRFVHIPWRICFYFFIFDLAYRYYLRSHEILSMSHQYHHVWSMQSMTNRWPKFLGLWNIHRLLIDHG